MLWAFLFLLEQLQKVQSHKAWTLLRWGALGSVFYRSSSTRKQITVDSSAPRCHRDGAELIRTPQDQLNGGSQF